MTSACLEFKLRPLLLITNPGLLLLCSNSVVEMVGLQLTGVIRFGQFNGELSKRLAINFSLKSWGKRSQCAAFHDLGLTNNFTSAGWYKTHKIPHHPH